MRPRLQLRCLGGKRRCWTVPRRRPLSDTPRAAAGSWLEGMSACFRLKMWGQPSSVIKCIKGSQAWACWRPARPPPAAGPSLGPGPTAARLRLPPSPDELPSCRAQSQMLRVRLRERAKSPFHMPRGSSLNSRVWEEVDPSGERQAQAGGPERAGASGEGPGARAWR